MTLIFIAVAWFSDSDAEILYSFPLLFPVVPVKIPGPKRKPWWAGHPEIQEGFLVHPNVFIYLLTWYFCQQVFYDIFFYRSLPISKKKLDDMRKTCCLQGATLQPFPMIVGLSLSSIISSYVVIYGRPILLESPLRAIEVDFKVH